MKDTLSQLNQAASQIDPLLRPCPRCGGQLRGEYKCEWRPMAEVCALFGVTEAEVRATGAVVDAFGRVQSGVPYVTCMECGLHEDGSTFPKEYRR